MLVGNLGSTGYETIIATGVQAIVFSVVLHGITAAPLARRYGAFEQRTEG